MYKLQHMRDATALCSCQTQASGIHQPWLCCLMGSMVIVQGIGSSKSRRLGNVVRWIHVCMVSMLPPAQGCLHQFQML